MHHIAGLVAKKRETLCRTVNQAMEYLIMEIAKEDTTTPRERAQGFILKTWVISEPSCMTGCKKRRSECPRAYRKSVESM